jgi:Malectin domain
LFRLFNRSVNGPEQRKFKVLFEGGAVTSDPIDIFALSGGKFTAHTIAYAVTVSDGVLNIGFQPLFENVQLCGIEIRPGSDLVVRSVPFYISAGPAVLTGATSTQNEGATISTLTESTDTVWVADAPYVTGGTLSTPLGPEVDILNTEKDGLYRKERYGDATMAYKIPIVNATYLVTLHFAEL